MGWPGDAAGAADGRRRYRAQPDHPGCRRRWVWPSPGGWCSCPPGPASCCRWPRCWARPSASPTWPRCWAVRSRICSAGRGGDRQSACSPRCLTGWPSGTRWSVPSWTDALPVSARQALHGQTAEALVTRASPERVAEHLLAAGPAAAAPAAVAGAAPPTTSLIELRHWQRSCSARFWATWPRRAGDLAACAPPSPRPCCAPASRERPSKRPGQRWPRRPAADRGGAAVDAGHRLREPGRDRPGRRGDRHRARNRPAHARRAGPVPWPGRPVPDHPQPARRRPAPPGGTALPPRRRAGTPRRSRTAWPRRPGPGCGTAGSMRPSATPMPRSPPPRRWAAGRHAACPSRGPRHLPGRTGPR